MEQIELKVEGMTCGACVARVSRALLGVPGVRDAEVDLARGLARASADDAGAAQSAMLQALAAAGYPAVPVTGATASTHPDRGLAAAGCAGAARAGRGCCCGH